MNGIGASWTEVDPAVQTVYALALSGTDLFASSLGHTEEGIFHSTDAGAHWTQVGLDGHWGTTWQGHVYWADQSVYTLAISGPYLFAGTYYDGVWRRPLSDFATGGVGREEEIHPESFELFQNYPNPFNPSTTIRFSTTRASHVRLSIFDVSGRMVRELVNGVLAPGTHEVSLPASGLTSGVYIYRIDDGNTTVSRKLIVLR